MAVDKSKRNRNAGTGAVHKKRSEASRKKKQAYDKRLNATPKQKKLRADRNRKRREQQKKGNPKARVGSKYDVSHQKDGTIKMEHRSKNRGKRGEGNRIKKK